MTASIAVQQPLRLFREGLAQLLASEHDIDVVAVVGSVDELIALCRRRAPSVALVAADSDQPDPMRCMARLCRALPATRVIGLTGAAPTVEHQVRARGCGVTALVSRAGGVSEILAAIRTERRPLQVVARERTDRASEAWDDATSVLTARETTVLQLVGAGCTSREISNRLTISHKTVENHKQRIFRKLGVQNQAHAVSIALKTGLFRPARVLGLAAAD